MSQDLPKINIYQKLQDVRVALQALPMNRSGHNKFAGYKYFELSDFMPNINRLFNEYGLFSIVSFTGEEASLTIINSEVPTEQITFFSPMSTAHLKGCHEVQNLGAVQTYLRRYLYILAMEIVEQDALDAKTGDSENKEKSPAVTPITTTTAKVPTTPTIKPICPACGKEKSVIAGKEEYGGGWVCYAKKAGGCGHKWQDAIVVTDFATKEQLEEIEQLAPKAQIGIMKILEKYKVGTLSMLTKEQANATMDKLNVIIETLKSKEKDIPY